MTSKGQITRIASKAGVDARVVERDYVLVHVVGLISAADADARVVFKGGTSLRLLHFEEYRYSADLDYSVIKGGEAKARALIKPRWPRGLPLGWASSGSRETESSTWDRSELHEPSSSILPTMNSW